jgi:hypothetical protein
MGAPYSNIGSKNDRAIVAYLIAYGLANHLTTILNADTIFPTNSTSSNAYPNVEIQSLRGKPLVPYVGTWVVETRIVIKYSAVQPVKPVNPDAARLAGDILIQNVIDALSLTDNGSDMRATATAITAAGRLLATTGTAQSQANNADMLDYSCIFWVPSGFERGQPDEEGTAWSEITTFESHCCPSNVD